MSRGRFVSRAISSNEELGSVSLEADYLFGRCIPHLDRDGRMSGHPVVVKSTACPLRDEIKSGSTPDLLRTKSGSTPDLLRTKSGSTPDQVPHKVREGKGREVKVREVKISTEGAEAPNDFSHLMGVCREVGLTDMQTNGSVLKALLAKYRYSELEAVIRGLRLVNDSYRSLVPLNSRQHGASVWAEAAQRYYQSQKPEPRKRGEDQMAERLDFSEYAEGAL